MDLLTIAVHNEISELELELISDNFLHEIVYQLNRLVRSLEFETPPDHFFVQMWTDIRLNSHEFHRRDTYVTCSM